MLKLLMDSPAFWAAVILGIFTYGTTTLMPTGTIPRLAHQLAAYLPF